MVSRFNEPITEKLLQGAVYALKEKGLGESNIEIFHVPGAFEIPIMLKKLCLSNYSEASKKYDGLIALGCLIKGETAHFEYICGPVSNMISQLSCDFNIPVGFGVLTCYTPEQAYERSLDNPFDAERNKGYESALTVLEMISLLKRQP